MRWSAVRRCSNRFLAIEQHLGRTRRRLLTIRRSVHSRALNALPKRTTLMLLLYGEHLFFRNFRL